MEVREEAVNDGEGENKKKKSNVKGKYVINYYFLCFLIKKMLSLMIQLAFDGSQSNRFGWNDNFENGLKFERLKQIQVTKMKITQTLKAKSVFWFLYKCIQYNFILFFKMQGGMS